MPWWLGRLKLPSSAAAVAGVQHQQHRRQQQVFETAHQSQASQEAMSKQDPEVELGHKLDLICIESLKSHFYGAGIAVAVSVNEEIKFRKAFGIKDFENFVPAEEVDDFTVEVQSVTKPFTAHCWMKYMEDHCCDWNSHSILSVVSDYPRFQYVPVANTILGCEDYLKIDTLSLEDDDGPVLLGPKHLLTHMSGLSRQWYCESQHYFKSASEGFRATKSFYRLLEHQPVTSCEYSNAGYKLIGVMLERLLPKSYENYMWEQLAMLNMTHTNVNHNGEISIGEHYPGYGGWKDDKMLGKMMRRCATVKNLSLNLAASGMISNVDDLDRFGNIHGRMYKQAFVDRKAQQDIQDPLERLPLSIEKIKMQHDTFSTDGNYDDEEFDCQGAGFEVQREIKSNVLNRRRLKLRLKHDGLGYGSRAFLSVSFHELDMDRDDADNEEDKQLFRRQLEPKEFEPGTISRCKPHQPSRAECVTWWELPPDCHTWVRGWDAYRRKRMQAELRRFTKIQDNYYHNALIYLCLMARTRDREAYYRYSSRLQNLLDYRGRYAKACERRVWSLERMLFRRLIYEHRRICRGEGDSMSRTHTNNLQMEANLFKENYSKPLIDEFQQSGDRFKAVERSFQELNASLSNQSTSWTDSLNAFQYQDEARCYDIRQPYNVLSSDWTRMQYSIRNDPGEDGHRLDDIELNTSDSCACPDFKELALKYVSYNGILPNDDGMGDGGDLSAEGRRAGEIVLHNVSDINHGHKGQSFGPEWSMRNGQRHYYHLDLDRRQKTYDEVESEFDTDIPPSWFRPHGSLRPPKKRRKLCVKVNRIVVSIVCNLREFRIQELGRMLDDAVAEHYFDS